MEPTVGRVVAYKLSQMDADAINKRYADTARHLMSHRANSNGVQIHFGNRVHVGQTLPLIVTAVFQSHLVNGQAFLDGNDTYWATSRAQGDDEGQWNWPVKV